MNSTSGPVVASLQISGLSCRHHCATHSHTRTCHDDCNQILDDAHGVVDPHAAQAEAGLPGAPSVA